MREIWFIRHGESESNAGLPTTHTAMIGLTPKGFAQAACAAAAIPKPPSLIVTSPYLRSKQSAQPAIERFPEARIEEWPVHEFSYLSLASREGTTSEQRKPLSKAFWDRCDPQHCDGEGAESFVALAARAKQILERMKHQEEAFAVVFSHGIFTRALMWIFLADPAEIDAATMKRFRSFRSGFSVPNASILKVYRNDAQELFFSTLMTEHLPPDLR
jgi:broad specificity phosphatase PhoE